MLYTLSLLTLLTRIQLNLLGRRTYLSSVVSLASPPPAEKASTISLENHDDDNYDNVYGNDFETNRKYLTFSWWLLHRGVKEITEMVTAAVQEVFGPVNPREDVTLERLSELILEVRKKIEGATEIERREHKWLPFLLPPKDQEETVLREQGVSSSESPEAESGNPMEGKNVDTNPSLRRLLDETSDLIESPTFTHVLTLLLNTCFSHLIDQRIAVEAFKVSAPDPASRFMDVTDRKCKIAQTLAVFCRQAHVIAAGSGEVDELSAAEEAVPNEYLAAIDQVKDLEGFAAVIYSSNFEFEATQDQQVAAEILKEAAEVQTQNEALQSQLESMEQEDEARPMVEETANVYESDQPRRSLSVVIKEEVIVEDAGDTAMPGSTTEISAPAPSADAAATPGEEGSGPPAFESAWVNALRKEDGQDFEEFK